MGFSWTLGYTGIFGIIALIALIGGGSYILRKFLKLPIPQLPIIGNPKTASMLAIVLGVMFFLPMISPQAAQSIGSSGSTMSIGTSTTTTDTTSCIRPTGGNTANQLIVLQNAKNPTTTYLASAYTMTDEAGNIIESGNTNAGTSLSYVTETVTPCIKGYIYVTGNSSVKAAFSSYVPQDQYIIKQALTTNINAFVYDWANGANATANGAVGTSTGAGHGDAGTAIVAHNLTIASGGSANGKFTLVAVTGNSEYGAYEATDGVIYGAYISDLSSSSAAGGVTLSSADTTITQITCPADFVSQKRVNICWQSPTLKSGKTYTYTVTFNGDLGDPAPGDYIDLFTCDKQFYFEAGTNVPSYGCYDVAGNDKGSTNNQIRWLFN
jgi:hypothetical protein